MLNKSVIQNVKEQENVALNLQKVVLIHCSQRSLRDSHRLKNKLPT